MKKSLLIFVGLLLGFNLYSQDVNIPDVNFLNELIKQGFDINKDGIIQQEEAMNITGLNLGQQEIYNLTGIEEFINLTNLNILYLPIKSLDLSKNTSLTSLWCWYTELNNLNISKNINLKEAYIHKNKLKCIPYLPNSLEFLAADSNCLPNIPNSKFRYHLNEWLDSIPIQLCDETNNKYDCNVYPIVKGRLYIDVDKNKKYTNGIDHPVINESISANYTTNTDSLGNYSFTVDSLNKTYTITPQLRNGLISTPISDNVIFTNMGEVFSGKNFIISPLETNDVRIQATPITVARPGFGVKYQVKIYSYSSTIQNPTVQLSYDQNLSYVTSLPLGTNSGNTLTWIASDLKPFEERVYTIEFTLSITTQLGTDIKSTATISIPYDNDLANNVSEIKQTVRGSYDPNDIQVNKGNMVLRTAIEAQEDFIYTIRFQNTGTDTAFTVVVRDTLPLNNFDLSSFQNIASSHPYLLKLKNNVLTWTFSNILLPDSTTNKLGSNGFIKFKLKPLSTLAIGDEIKNKAAIYFDFNDPVITNTVNTRVSIISNLETDSESKTYVFPNPTKGVFNVSVGSNDALIQLLSISGEIILEKNVSENTRFDLSAEYKGIYFLKIKTADKTEVKKLVME